MESGQELEQLRARVAHLESLVEKLTGSRPAVRREASPSPSSGLDRRRMLRHGLGLSAATVAGVGLLDAVGSSAAATDGDAVTVGQTVSPTSVTSAPTRIVSQGTDVHAASVFRVDNTLGGAPGRDADMSAAIVASYLGTETPEDDFVGAAIIALSDTHIAFQADCTSGWALHAKTDTGTAAVLQSNSGAALGAFGYTTAIEATSNGPCVTATSESDVGLTGSGMIGVAGSGRKNSNGDGGWGVAGSGQTGVAANGAEIGVDASCDTGIAVKATSTSGTGVDASSTSGTGVVGTSDQATGVKGTSTSAAGVYAVSGSGAALLAESDSGTAVAASSSTGIAVTGSGTTGVVGTGTQMGVRGTSDTGVGVSASSTHGIGGTFQGAAAPIRLVPTSTGGPPTAGQHLRGEIVLDHHGTMWVCTKVGTPGTWRQVAFA